MAEFNSATGSHVEAAKVERIADGAVKFIASPSGAFENGLSRVLTVEGNVALLMTLDGDDIVKAGDWIVRYADGAFEKEPDEGFANRFAPA